MPIPLPNLDDRTFADLTAETRALIPSYAPEWTDHNPSDPGITLLELFAWLTEILIIRLNRIPQDSEARFFELLGAIFPPARPARVRLEVTALNLGGEALTIPRGTPFTTATPGSNARIPFETIHDLPLAPDLPRAAVEARQTSRIESASLGVSTGQAHQAFSLLRGKFIVLDEASSTTLPAPFRLMVGNKDWTYRPSLLYSTAQDQHFTIEPRLNTIRFGDDSLGRIPPAGAEIAIAYHYTLGQAGNVSDTTAFEVDQESSFLP